MPKKLKYEEDELMDEDGPFEDEETEEVEEEDFSDEILPPKTAKKPSRPNPVPVKKQVRNDPPEQTKKDTSRRYSYFAQQPVEGVADAETGEVIGTNLMEILANILERLERIENKIGEVIEG